MQVTDIIENIKINENSSKRNYPVSSQEAYSYFGIEYKDFDTSASSKFILRKKQLSLTILKKYLEGNERLFFTTNIIGLLGSVLESTDLNVQEIGKILFSVIEKAPKPSKFKKTIDIFKVITYYYPDIISEEILKSYIDGDESKIINFIKNDSRLKPILNDESFYLDIPKLFEQVKIIQDVPASKDEKNNLNDIFKVIDALMILGVNPNLLYALEEELTKNCYSREYAEYLEQIKQYYNVENGEIVNSKVSKEDREKIVIAMISINLSKETIIKFLKGIDDPSKEDVEYEEEYNFYYGKIVATAFEYQDASTDFDGFASEKKWIIDTGKQLLNFQNKDKEYSKNLLIQEKKGDKSE